MSSDSVPVLPPQAISVRQVSKAYRIWSSPSARLTVPAMQGLAKISPPFAPAQRWFRAKAERGFRDFYALREVSFDVPKGECLGVVGRNGAGKSTLLQLITGTLRPSSGTIAVNGRVAALLELGSGFNPEFTGRENVFLNASILGLAQSEIEARYDDILRFAEIGDFIDEPVKVYSSGMTLRLAFAVVAHVDADILIIDEALAVGDARFQLKCARAIDRFREQGATLLFVSHDMSMVKRLCTRALLIEGGRVIFAGRPNSVVNLYSKLLAEGGSLETIQPDIEALKATPECEASSQSTLGEAAPSPAGGKEDARARQSQRLLEDERAHLQVSGQEYAYGGDLGRIDAVHLFADADGGFRTWFTSGESICLSMDVVAADKLPHPIYALTIKDRNGQEVYGTNTLYANHPVPAINRGEKHRVNFRFAVNLIPGTYFISLGWTQFVGEELVVVHRRYDVIKFDVHGVDRAFGIANLWADIHIQTVP